MGSRVIFIASPSEPWCGGVMQTEEQGSVSKTDDLRTRTSLLEAVGGSEGGRRWDEFDRVYRPLMIIIAREAGLTAHDAEDVVQNSFATLLRNLHRFSVRARTGSFRRYLRLIVDSRARDWRRQQRREPATVEAGRSEAAKDELWANIPAPEESLEPAFAAVVERAMRSMAARLGAREVQLLDLYYYQDWPARRVAETLNMTEANVHQVAHRYKRQLLCEVLRWL